MPKLRSETNGNTPTNSGESSKRRKARVPIYKNDDGTLDLSGLTDDDAAKVRERFGSSPGAAFTPPPPTEPTAPPPEPIDPAIIMLALNMLTSIEAAVVGSKLHIPTARAYEALALKPPFDQMLIGAATKVANKYMVSMGPYADEIALGALLVTWQIGAFTELRAIAAELATARGETPPPNVDHDKHQSPPPPPPPPSPEPMEKPKPKSAPVIPIDAMIAAQMGAQPFGVNI